MIILGSIIVGSMILIVISLIALLSLYYSAKKLEKEDNEK